MQIFAQDGALHFMRSGAGRPVDAAILEVLLLAASDGVPAINGSAQRAMDAAHLLLPDGVESATAGHIHNRGNGWILTVMCGITIFPLHGGVGIPIEQNP